MNNTNAFRSRAMGSRRPWPNAGRLFVMLVGLLWSGLLVSRATDWYVATNGTGNGTSWAAATNSLQGAIDASSAGETVWVSNGVYEVGGVTNYPSGTILTNRVAIYKAITVQSKDNDPTNTIIKGFWDPATNGPAAVRCVWMTNGSKLIGFTLTNGATASYGGGVYCQSTNTVISNCVLTGNSAYYYGGGAYYGTLFNCTLTGNSAGSGGSQGGGAYYSTLFNCTLTGNSTVDIPGTAEGGGGAFGSTLSNCTLTGNSAPNGSGGGANNSTLFNCTLISNSSYYAGGANGSTLSNCTLIGNSGTYGGGGYGGTLYNCTLTGNSAGQVGGGALGGTLYNCMIVSNSAGGSGGNGAYNSTLFNCTLFGNFGGYGSGARLGTLYNCTIVGNSGNGGGTYDATLYNCITWNNSTANSLGTWYYSCAAGLTNGGSVSGNITNDPLFVANGSGYGSGHVAGNYRLRNESPPLNAGTNYSWMTPPDVRSRDLDGQRRIDRFSRQVDMGCYELMLRGTLFIFGGQ